MTPEVALLVTSRLLSATTAIIDISTELQKLSLAMQAAHNAGKTFTIDDLNKMDADLADAKKAAHDAVGSV